MDRRTKFDRTGRIKGRRPIAVPGSKDEVPIAIHDRRTKDDRTGRIEERTLIEGTDQAKKQRTRIRVHQLFQRQKVSLFEASLCF